MKVSFLFMQARRDESQRERAKNSQYMLSVSSVEPQLRRSIKLFSVFATRIEQVRIVLFE